MDTQSTEGAARRIDLDKAMVTLLKYTLENSIKLTSIMKRQLELKVLIQDGAIAPDQVNEELTLRLAQIDELLQKQFQSDLNFIAS